MNFSLFLFQSFPYKEIIIIFTKTYSIPSIG